MGRIPGVVLLIGLMTTTALADVLVVSKGRKNRVLGLPDEIDGVEVNESNWRIYLPQSDGVILEENYDSIVWKKNSRTKATDTYPLSEVVESALAPMQRHAALDQGHGAFASRNLAGAIRAFQECVEDADARPVDRAEANFMIGYTYAAFGRLPLAERHFESWNGGKSKYTPDAYRLLAEIQTGRKKYDDARKTYQRIIDLPDIPETWKLKAQAGMVKVDIDERKFAEAEKAAAALASKAASKPELADGRALAMGLQAQAIIAAQEEARYPDAEKVLRAALELKGVSDTNLAFLNSTLGDALYAQKNLEAARFPYLRVVELYPDERGYVANSLLNAGNCFIDMAGKAQNQGDEKLYCEYMIKGMLLISECGLKYKGTAAARQAGAVWKRNRAAYEACKSKK